MTRKIALSVATSLILSQSIYAEDTQELDSVTVTANKMEENVQEVPISMSVFDEFYIEDSKIESIQDVASHTSNFVLTPKSAMTFQPTVRGISNSLPESSAGSQSTSVIIDGIAVSSSRGFNETLMDIHRIEVLKGPQGTLYGKEAEAGVINIITNQPDNETRGKIGVELGEDNKRQYTFSASGPIVQDKLYVGIAAKHYEKDGFIKNTLGGGYVNDKENDYGRVNLRYTPTDDLEISLISSKLQFDNGQSDYLDTYTPDDKSISSDQESYNKSSTTSHALKVSYDISDYLLESITTYRKVKIDSYTDYSKYSDQIEDVDEKKSSQEFRLSNDSDVFKWVAGIYADKSKNRDASHSVTSTPNPSTTKSDSFGVFIHTDYTINDKFSFISGARYDKDNKDYEQSTTKLDFSDSEISPKISLKYQHDKNSMYYATISKGYRSGGIHASAPDGYSKEYDTETLWNYEIGAKNSFFDNRLTLNSSIFYMKIDDMQVRVYPVAGSYNSYVDNAAKATSKGFEIGLNAKLTDTIELFGAYGYADSTFDEFSDSRGDYSGNKNTFAPDYNYNVGIQYRGEEGYFARVDVNGYGRTYFDNTNENSRDPYRLVNAKIGYEAESYDVYVYGKNIFDKEYYAINMFNSNGVLYSEQREIGVQLAYRF
ncbi:MAG: TonB-dependent receptor [Sphaerochaetaceae bacterium]|nr:TonB-dependent receptor [Sphaerochaetaceae bacterium]